MLKSNNPVLQFDNGQQRSSTLARNIQIMPQETCCVEEPAALHTIRSIYTHLYAGINRFVLMEMHLCVKIYIRCLKTAPGTTRSFITSSTSESH
jgi:hypothetical protein